MLHSIKKKFPGQFAYSLTLVFIIFCLLGNSSFANFNPDSLVNKATIPAHEVFDDPYAPSPRENHLTSPAYSYSIPGFTVVQVNVNGFGTNILDDAANEPSITYNPQDPNNMVIGWRQFDNINNNFRQAGIGYTYNGGLSWTFPEVIDPGIFRSDPVLDCDTEGNIYYNSLTVFGDDYWCDVFKTEDGGTTWDTGVFAQGGDKQWMTIDKSGGIGNGNIYAFWNVSYSICEPGSFTRSFDGGLSYEDCVSVPNNPYWGTNVVDSDGNLYVCGKSWGGNFKVSKSVSAQNPELPVIWDFTSTVNLDGELLGWGGYTTPNPNGLHGQAIITVDSSEGPTHGNVYLLASVERFSNSDPMDVMFAKSTDGGLTWNNPVRINNDLTFTAWQWFGTMSVAPDGRIDVIWLDTRDNPGTVLSVLYYAYSLDGGDTWSDNFALSEAFDPHLGWPQQDKMGDYYDMYSDDAGAHLAWSATFNGEQDVYYSLITPQFTGNDEFNEKPSVSLSQNFPNPFKVNTNIRYYITEPCFVSIKIFDITGREVANVINETKNSGSYISSFKTSDLESGIYYYQLKAGNTVITKKMMILE